MALNLFSQIKNSAERCGERAFIDQDRKKTSYLELCLRAEKLCFELKELGLTAGSAVIIDLPDGTDFIIGLLALLHAEAVSIPLRSTDLKDIRLLDLKANYILSKPASASKSFSLKTLSAVKLPFLAHIPMARFVRLTSGTTGTPKGVVFSEESVLRRIDSTKLALAFTEQDRLLWLMPMAYHFIASILYYLREGISLIIPEQNSATSINSTLARQECTIIYASPEEYKTLLLEPAAQKVTSLRLALCSGAKLSPFISKQFLSQYGLPISQIYGMIEIGLVAGNIDNSRLEPELCGKAFPGFQLCIFDQQWRKLDAPCKGRLAFKGPGFFDGYLDPTSLHASSNKDGWYLSGDLAELRTDGQLIVLGRESSCIESEGHWVFPESIENVLDSHPSVRRSRAFAEPHGSLKAEVELIQGRLSSTEELLNFCIKALPDYSIPHEIAFTEKIALTPTGKIKRA